MSNVEKPTSKGRSKLDPTDRRLLTDLLSILAILIATVLLYWDLAAPAALIGGGLSLSAVIAADVALIRRGAASSRNFRMRPPSGQTPLPPLSFFLAGDPAA